MADYGDNDPSRIEYYKRRVEYLEIFQKLEKIKLSKLTIADLITMLTALGYNSTLYQGERYNEDLSKLLKKLTRKRV
jgi:hypothetical protein